MKLKPFEIKTTQPGTPLMSQDVRLLLEQNKALAFEASGNSYSNAFPYEQLAPSATLAAASTAYGFTLLGGAYGGPSDSCEYSIPWQVQNQYDKITAVVNFASDKQYAIKMRAKTDDLISAVALTTGAWSRVVNLEPTTPPLIGWSHHKGWCVGAAFCEITPTLPADRRVRILFEVQTDEIVYPANGSADVRIMDVWLTEEHVES